MSELREDVHKNDFLMDTLTKDLYFVIKIDMHTVWLRQEKDDLKDPDDPEIKQMPKHMVNRAMIKVKPDVIKILYGNKDEAPTTDDDTDK